MEATGTKSPQPLVSQPMAPQESAVIRLTFMSPAPSPWNEPAVSAPENVALELSKATLGES